MDATLERLAAAGAIPPALALSDGDAVAAPVLKADGDRVRDLALSRAVPPRTASDERSELKK